MLLTFFFFKTFTEPWVIGSIQNLAEIMKQGGLFVTFVVASVL